MSATVYRDPDFLGPFAHLRPGFLSGRDLVGYHHQSTQGEDLDNAISSIRVGPNTIAALYAGHSMSAASGARVLVGPQDVPDLAALGIGDKISALMILSFKGYDSAIPRGGGVTLYGGYEGGGKHSFLEQGDYNAARLASEEVKFPDNRLRSLRVSSNVVAVLYDGPDFDTTTDAVVVVGPTLIGDLDSVGLLDRMSSIRVLFTDPYDVPQRPVTPIGSTRANVPGGAAGYPMSPDALSLMFPDAGNQHPYGPNWAGSSAPPPSAPPPSAPPPSAPPPSIPLSAPPRAMWIMILVLVVVVAALVAAVAALSRPGRAKKGADAPAHVTSMAY